MDARIYIIFLPVIVVCAIFAGFASRKVHSAFAAFDDVPTRSRMTGYDTATRLLRRNGVTDISVGRVRGRLSDHYHPTKKIVNLSESTYGSHSVAAVAVAAHEIGHVMQKKRGYFPYKIRLSYFQSLLHLFQKSPNGSRRKFYNIICYRYVYLSINYLL